MRKLKCSALVLLSLVLSIAAGCQHATDDGTASQPFDSAEQASEATVLFRTPADGSAGYVHLGFHPETGFGTFHTLEPVETVQVDIEQGRDAVSSELDDKIRRAAQAQQSDPGFGEFISDVAGPSGGPTYSASTVVGQSYSARAPGSGGYSAQAPGTTGDGPAYTASATEDSNFSATASAGAGKVCSLRPFCDFFSAICEVYPDVTGTESCGNVQLCYSQIAQSGVSSDLSRQQLCAVSTLFGCAARTIRQVRPSLEGRDGFALLGSLFYCAREAGFQPME